jgi:hypothetical protein
MFTIYRHGKERLKCNKLRNFIGSICDVEDWEGYARNECEEGKDK